MAETVAGRFTTHPAFPVAAGTEVNLDASASLLNAKTYLEFRALVKTPYAYNSDSWVESGNFVFYAFEDGNNLILLRYNEILQKWSVAINSGGTSINLLSAAQTFAADTWIDLVVTLDFTNDNYKLYINGALADTNTTALAVIAAYSQMDVGSSYLATGQCGFAVDTFMVADYACGLQALYGLDVNPRHLDVLGLGVQPLTVGGVVSDTALVSTHAIDGDVRWRRPGSVELWNVTSSPGSLTVTNNGQDDAYPIINITPRAAKAGGFQYQRWVPVVWKVATAYTNYPIRIDALNLTGKAQADGDDIRVYSDGSEVDRWLSGTLVSAVTTWFNLSFSANIPMTLDGDITDSATTLVVNEDITDMPATGILMIGTEAITYASKTTLTKTFSGCTRGAKYTTAAAHSNTDAVTWIQHDVFLYYGDASLTAPVTDDDYKPLITLASSSNDSWVFAEFGCTAGTRPGQWSFVEALHDANVTVTSYTGEHNTNTSPWTDIGASIVTASTGQVAGPYWHFYNPCLITGYQDFDIDNRQVGDDIYVIIGTQATETGSIIPRGLNHLTLDVDLWITWPATDNSGWSAPWVAMKLTPAADTPTAYDAQAEINSVQLDFDTDNTPDATAGAEQASSYNLTAVLANSTTGESITLNTTLELDDTVTIDCDNSTMTNAAGTSLLSGKTLNTVRQHWLRLLPGANALTYTETGVADVDLSITWEDRLYE
jgi:hypothetical protein